jgi:antitoxin component YwqK of YwqJK toxin-antitoxin module
VKAARDAPDNWRDLLPELSPRSSPFGKLCAPWDDAGCRELCDAGSALSCARLGNILVVGGAENALLPVTKFKQDFAATRVAWQSACHAGYQPSCVDLAWLLAGGHGGKRDDKRAEALRDKACNAGYAVACNSVAATEAPLAIAGSLACPKGTSHYRERREMTLAYTIVEPALYCGKPGERRPAKHGPFIQWASLEDEAVHGVVIRRGNYVDGQREGVWEISDARGRLISTERYRGGKKHGTFLRHSADDPNYLETTEYVTGKRQGSYKKSSNDSSESGNYVDGNKHGAWLRTYRRKKTETNYDRGRIVGDVVRYRTDGSVHHRIPHDSQGRRHGAYNIYGRDGKVLYETLYHHGDKSKARSYHNNGKLSREVVYQDGEEVSERRFDRHGKPLPEGD